MYETGIDCYKDPIKKPYYSIYKGPPTIIENFTINEKFTKKQDIHKTNMEWKTSNYTTMSDPSVWGQAFWFTLHNGSSKYPISASPFTINRMKGFINGIPTMLPCPECKIHANNHIEKNKNNLDDICSGRMKLFKFFVDFHNIVNKKYNKPIITVDEAYSIYDGSVSVTRLTYK
jgi:hypothetical protein